MTSDDFPLGDPREPKRRVPRWLHVLPLGLIGVLLFVVLFLLFAYLAAGPGDNLAGVLVILAGLLAVPLLLALCAYFAAYALRRRSPGVALGLLALSTATSGFGVLLVIAYVLLSLGA